MKSIFQISVFCFLSISIQSQDYNELIFNNKLNHLITKKSNVIPKVYQVDNRKIKEITKTSIKQLTPEYREAFSRLKKVEKENLEYTQNEEAKLYRLEANDEISIYINDFFNSKEKLGVKIETLKSAQIISNKYSLGYFLYADSEINAHYENRFIDFLNNKKDLKNHLKGILSQIESKRKKNKKNKTISENTALTEAREHLKTVKKYSLVKGESSVTNTIIYTLGNELINPVQKMSGHFEIIGNYFVLNDNKKNKQLISVKEVEHKKVDKEKLFFKKPAMLIKHSILKTIYLVSNSFVNQYAINRVASQGKFKGKTSFPHKVYSNNDEKEFDSLVLEYNKSRIASVAKF